MSTRHQSLHGRAETFAQPGGSADAETTTGATFDLARRLGASGIDCPVWLTADGTAVVNQSDSVGSRLRRRLIRHRTHSDLPPDVPTLEQVVAGLRPDQSLLLPLADDHTFEAVVELVRQLDPEREERLWLCSADIDRLTSWRLETTAHLVSSVRLSSLKESPERWVSQLAERAIDGLQLGHTEWTAGLVALAHRFDRYAMARGAEHERELATLLDIGVDAVSSRRIDRMVAVATLYYPQQYRAD